MKQVVAAALLGGLVGVAPAATFTGSHFVVDVADHYAPQLVGDTLHLSPSSNGKPFGASSSGPTGEPGFNIAALIADYRPMAGYGIQGFVTTYDVWFSGGSYLVRGTEYGSFAPLYGPGDTWLASATIDFEHYDSLAGRFVTAQTRLTSASPLELHLVQESPGPLFETWLKFTTMGRGEFCRDGFDIPTATCRSPHWVVSTLALRSISVTPVIAVIPEPATHALLLGGLLALGLARRRRPSAAKGRSDQDASAAAPCAAYTARTISIVSASSARLSGR